MIAHLFLSGERESGEKMRRFHFRSFRIEKEKTKGFNPTAQVNFMWRVALHKGAISITPGISRGKWVA